MYVYIKQLFDYICSFVMTLILLPILIIIAAIIKLDSKGPVLFKQKRVGKDNKHFEIYKFRTMRTDTPKDMPTHLFNNAESFITPIGRFLRKSSLDELPQLFNILKGEMSFVGPRPALWNQYDLIEARNQCGANLVKPGITGWAQINGRDEIPIEQKAKLDGEYVKSMSLMMDIKILFLTVFSILKSEGVSEGGPKKG